MVKSTLHNLTLKNAPLLLRHILADIVVSVELVESTPKYYIPKSVTGELLKDYKDSLDWIEKYFSTIKKHQSIGRLSTDLLPYAHLVDIKISANNKQLIKAATRLRAFNEAYFSNLSTTLLSLSGDKLEGKVEISSSEQALPIDRELIKLVDYSPKTEIEILAHAMYPDTISSFDEVIEELESLKYKQRYDMFRQYTDNNLVESKYTFESIVEPRHIHQLSQDGVIHDISQQAASPYYGYDIHVDDEQASISEMFQRCYDMSYKLFSKLIDAEQLQLAQLVVLQGHRQRYLISATSSALREVNKKLHLAKDMSELAAGVHPTIFEED